MKMNKTITAISFLAVVLLVGCNGRDIIIDGDSPYSPVEVTNPILNFRTSLVHIDGTRAYGIGPQQGMLVFDVSDPSNSRILSLVLEDYGIRDFAISNSHMFVLDSEQRFSIFVVDSLETGQPISVLDGFESLQNIRIKGDIAYIGSYEELVIVDISNLASPGIINRIEAYISYPFEVHNGVAYTGGYRRLTMIDVDPPEAAYVIETIEVPGLIYGVRAQGDYLYLAGSYDGLTIMDIAVPESPILLSTLELEGQAYDVEVVDEYSYMANSHGGFQVVDVHSTVMPELVGSIETSWRPVDVEISGNMAYVSDDSSSLNIIDITSPESPAITGILDNPVRCSELALRDGYAYVVKPNALCIVDIDPVSEALTVGTVAIPGSPYGIAVAGNYAYVGTYRRDVETNFQYGEIEAINIANPSMPVIETSHRMNIIPRDLAFANGYLHVVGRYYDPVNHQAQYTAYVMLDAATFENIATLGIEVQYTPNRIHLRNGYAYLTTSSDLYILDVDPPEDMHPVKTLDIRAGNAVISDESGDGSDLLAQSGFSIPERHNGQMSPPYIPPYRIDMAFTDMYAYVCYGGTGTMLVIDYNPPESAQIIGMYDMPGHCTALSMGEDNDYIFASFSDIGLAIIDINPPDECRLAEIFSTENETMDVVVDGEYAYIADSYAGLRIIDLR